MKVVNIFPHVIKQNANEYIDGQNKSIYAQNIKILGGFVRNQDQLVFIYNDRAEIAAQEKLVSHLCIFDIQKQSMIHQQEIKFKDYGQIFLSSIIYNSYQVYLHDFETSIFQLSNNSTEVINQVVEDIRKKKIIIFTSQRAILFDLDQNKILDQCDLLINSAVNITTDLLQDDFAGFELGENDVYFVHFKINKDKIEIIEKEQTSELDHCYSFSINNQIQLILNQGTFYTHNIKSIYFTHGYYKDQCNSLSCFNTHSQVVEYLYPTVAPVIALTQLQNYLFYNSDNQCFYDIIAFADAAGFLTITLGGTNVWERRLITVQTNMLVKQLQFNVKECENEDQNAFPLIYINHFLQQKDKKVVKYVNNQISLTIFGQTDLCKGDQQLTADGFSILYFNLKDMLQTMKADYVQEDERSDDFSYVDYKIQERQDYQSSEETNSKYSLSEPNFVPEEEEEIENEILEESNQTTYQLINQNTSEQKEKTFEERIQPLLQLASNQEILNLMMQQNQVLKNKQKQHQLWNDNQINSQNIKQQQIEQQNNQSVNQQAQQNAKPPKKLQQNQLPSQNSLENSIQISQQQNKSLKTENITLVQPSSLNQDKNDQPQEKTKNKKQSKTKHQDEQNRLSNQQIQQQNVQQKQQQQKQPQQIQQNQQLINQTYYLTNGEMIKIIQIYKQLPYVLLTFQNFSVILSQPPLQILYLQLKQVKEYKGKGKNQAKNMQDQQEEKCIPHILVLNSDQCQLFNCETNTILLSMHNSLNNNICIIISQTNELYPMFSAPFIEVEKVVQPNDIYIVTNKCIVNLMTRQDIVFPAQYLQNLSSFVQSPGWLLCHQDDLFFFVNQCTIVVLYVKQQKEYQMETLVNLEQYLLCCEDLIKLQLYLEQSRIPKHIKQYCVQNIQQKLKEQTNKELNPSIPDIQQLKFTQMFMLFQYIMQLAVTEFYVFHNVQFIETALKQLYEEFKDLDDDVIISVRQYLLQFQDAHQGLPNVEKYIKAFFKPKNN